MAHTSSIFLIDRAGKLRALMPFGHDAADFVHDIDVAVGAVTVRMRPRPWKLLMSVAGRERRRLVAIALSLLVLGGLGWAALAPIEVASRDELFEIPHGTWARRMAGEKVEILPQTIRLTLGINDVLLLRNADEVPQMFGPTLIMPGQSFSLPFRESIDLQLHVHRACQRADEHDRGTDSCARVGNAALALAQTDEHGVALCAIA